MRCRQVHGSLLLDIKGETDAATHENIEKHLVQCAKCQKLKREIIAHIEIYKRLTPFEPSSHSWRELSSRMRQVIPVSQSPAYSRYSLCFGVVTFLALMAFFVFTYWFPREPEWDIRVLQGKPRLLSSNQAVLGNLALKSGTKLNTLRGETARCVIQRNISMVLLGDTALELAAVPRLILRNGEICISSSGREKLVIETDAGEIHMMGTAFSVHCHKFTTIVEVHRGSVGFRNKHGNLVGKEGQILKAEPGAAPELLEKKTVTDYPWWSDTPVLLNLEVYFQNPGSLLLCLHLFNTRPQQITLAPLSGGTPRFCIHVEHLEKSYTIPLRSVSISPRESPLVLSPLSNCDIKCDVSQEIQEAGDYSFIAVYTSHGENGWQGIVASPPLKVSVE